MRVALFQLDGKLPNIALMRLAAHHRASGDEVELIRGPIQRDLWSDWDAVYGSLIFEKSRPKAQLLKSLWPNVILGGTGWDEKINLENYGVTIPEQDYGIYPDYPHSIGYSQRGCRFDCWFCKVPKAEPVLKPTHGIWDIWRGEPWPRNVILLDNDFFGVKQWRDRIGELQVGNFKVCFSQGINVRVLSDEHAAAIASVRISNSQFTRRRLYCAWDDSADERVVFRGLERLRQHGVKPDEIVVYMLIGAGEPHEDRERRRAMLREFGCRPYPMPYVRNDETRGFQRWVVRRADLMCGWDEFQRAGYQPQRVGLKMV